MVPAVSRQRFRPVPSLLRSYPLKGCAPAPPGIGSFPRLFTLSFIPLLRNKFRHAKINRLFVRVEYLSQILDVQRVRDPNCRSDCGFTRAVFIRLIQPNGYPCFLRNLRLRLAGRFASCL